MKLLPQLILISAGVALLGFLPTAAHAVSCQAAPKGGFGGVTPDLTCGPSGANGYIFPPADIPMCGATPCYALTVLPNAVISLPAKATPAWGTTIAQVQQLLPYNMLLDFEENVNIDAAVTSMGDTELARFSTELASNDVSDYTYSIMAYAGERLSAANLRRLQAAVGPTVFATAIAYMSPSTLAAYNTAAVYAPIPLGVYWNSLNPTLAAQMPNGGDLYVYDVLLDEKLSSAGETSTVALANVSRYINLRVKNIAVVALIVAIGFGILQVWDSPHANALANDIADWYFIQNAIAANGTGRMAGPIPLNNLVFVNIPNLGVITPPTIDPGPVPPMPAVEGDAAQNGASGCPNPDNCPTSST